MLIGKYKKYNKMLCIVVCMMIAQCISCENVQYKLPAYDGKIILMGKICTMFNIKEGSIKKIDFGDKYFNARILCKNTEGLYLVLANKIINQKYNDYIDYSRQYGTNVFHLFDESNDSLKVLDSALHKQYYTYTLDCRNTLSQYLFCGYYQNDVGLFLLDTYFNIIDDYTYLFYDHDATLSQAFFVQDQSIIINDNNKNIFLCDPFKSDREFLDKGYILTVSKNKNLILFSNDGLTDKYNRLFLYNLETKSKYTLQRKIKYATNVFGFSPDNKNIAFFERAGLLGDGLRLTIYNIDQDSLYKTNVLLGEEQWGGSINWISN